MGLTYGRCGGGVCGLANGSGSLRAERCQELVRDRPPPVGEEPQQITAPFFIVAVRVRRSGPSKAYRKVRNPVMVSTPSAIVALSLHYSRFAPKNAESDWAQTTSACPSFLMRSTTSMCLSSCQVPIHAPWKRAISGGTSRDGCGRSKVAGSGTMDSGSTVRG